MIRCLAQLLTTMLFILLGTGFAIAKSQTLLDLIFLHAQIDIVAQYAMSEFDTRAPPSAAQYVATQVVSLSCKAVHWLCMGKKR